MTTTEPPVDGLVHHRGLTATMADGSVLVADAWHPATGGPWPVLLQRLPYGRSVASTPVLPHPTWFARRGYAVVVQDCRGRGDSSGTFAPFVHEASDGAATIEWAAQLAFSDGRVATYGFSYQGLAQLYAAAERPPSLLAIAPMMCCPDPYEGWTYEGGLRRWPFVCFWSAQLAGQDRRTGPIPFAVDAVPISDALGDDPPPWFTEWLAHPRDDDYWASRRPDLGAIGVPAFTVMGWFDDFSSGTAAIIGRLGADAWCGPWAHMPWGTSHGSVEFGPDASPAPVWDALVAFFDRAMGRTADREARVRYFVIGDGWREAATWPPPHRVVVFQGRSPGGNANSRWGDGHLIPDDTEFLATPRERIGTESFARAGQGIGSTAMGAVMEPPTVLVAEPHAAHPGHPVGYQDDAPAHDRRDVACYTTDPLASPLDVTGSPVVRAITRCDRPSHDLVATLAVVAPDGTARTVTGYGARLMDRVEPGADTPWTIELRPIAVRVPTGHRLRLSLSGARFPCYDRNGHTADHDPDTGPAGQVVATIAITSVELEVPIPINHE